MAAQYKRIKIKVRIRGNHPVTYRLRPLLFFKRFGMPCHENVFRR